MRLAAHRVYPVVAGAFGVAYFAFPGHHLLTWSPLGFSAALAVVAGVLLHRPPRPGGWLLLAAALLFFVSGDTCYNVLVDVLGRDNPFPSPADALYLATYPCFAAGLVLLVHSRGAPGDRGGLLDALIVTTGVGYVSWVLLIEPYVHDRTLTLVEKLVSVAYPLGDVLILAIVVRLVGRFGARSPAVRLLLLGAVGLLVSDAFYGLIQLYGDWRTNGPVDVGWVVFYVCWGTAALHPSMAAVGGPAAPAGPGPARSPLPLLAAAGLLVPVTLTAQSLAGGVRGAAVAGASSTVLFLLVLARLEGVVRVHRESVARERALRAASVDIGAAADGPDLETAIVTSALRLLPAGPPPRAELHLAGRRSADLSLVEVAAAGSGRLATTRLGLAPIPAAVGAGPTRPGRGDGWECVAVPVPLTPPGMLVVVAGTVADEAVEALGAVAAQAALAMEGAELAEDLRRRRSEAQFRTLIQNASDVIVVLGPDGTLRYVSPSAERVLGVGAERLHGRPLADFLHPDDADRALEQLSRSRRGASAHTATDWRLVGPDGVPQTYEVLINDLTGDETVGGVVLTLRDVTERRALEQELTHQAFHDSLTGLANRALFGDRTAHALARSARVGGTVGVLLIDLDDFKLVNDTRGHGAGDELLVAVARRLVAGLHPDDTAARLGGDEFAVLIESGDGDAVRATAQGLLAELARPFRIGVEPVQVGACIGLALSAGSPGSGAAGRPDLGELMRRADLALYAGKERGKNRVVEFHADMHTRMVRRVGARADLQRALEDDQLFVLFQPIVELATGAVVACEALVRWQHPERGLVGPVEFVPVAEETGLIVPIGAFVLDRACAQARTWRDRFPDRPLRMSVNVSGRQIHDDDLVGVVRETVARHDVPTGALMLEITEGVLLQEDTAVLESLEALRALGARIAIDDFGTGYSSLGYLQRLPVDVLKIDRSFVAGLVGDEPQAATPARTVVALAHNLGLGLVAEGIETPEQAAELRRLGCGLGQGFLYARPLPADEITDLLARGALLIGDVDAPVGVPAGGPRPNGYVG